MLSWRPHYYNEVRPAMSVRCPHAGRILGPAYAGAGRISRSKKAPLALSLFCPDTQVSSGSGGF